MKGSFTIEAALVMSIILLVLGQVMHQTIELYKQVEETAKECEIDDMKPVTVFRNIQWLYEIKEQIKEQMEE